MTLQGRKRRRDGQRTLTVGVIFTIVNTHKGVLEWCQTAIGHGCVVQTRSTPANPRNLPTFRYNLDQAHVLRWLLPILRPYLKVKWPQTEAVLRYLQSREGAGRGVAFTHAEIDAIFDCRLTNQKSYNKGVIEHILYRKQPYTREQFRELLLAGRDGSIYRVVSWTPAMDALVGTDIDRKVAVRLGLKLAHVQRRRVELGRPPFGAITEAKIQRVLKMRRARTKLKQIVAKTGVSLTSVERILQRASQAKENDLGYGTPQHQRALAELGPCPIHRKTYAPIAKAIQAKELEDERCGEPTIQDLLDEIEKETCTRQS